MTVHTHHKQGQNVKTFYNPAEKEASDSVRTEIQEENIKAKQISN